MPRKGRNIYKRKDNRWEARVYISGGRKYRSVYGKTYKEAMKKQDKLCLEMGITDNGDYLMSALAEQWLENKRYTVREGTIYSYSIKLKNHILPYFSEVYFSKLNEQMLSGFIAAKRAEGLSEKYISDMIITIKSISSWANKHYGLIDKVRNFKNVKVPLKEPKILNSSEQKRLQQHLIKRDDSISLGLFTEMFTGLRIGELCGLKWSDIDLENGVININKSVQRLPNKNTGKSEVKISKPKTATSSRLIPIPVFLIDKLKQHKQADDYYILSNSKKVIEPRLLNNKFKNILAENNLPSVTFHSLRHAFATNCIQSNFDIKTLSEILGHSSANVTMRIYIHTSMEQKRACMNKLKPF